MFLGQSKSNQIFYKTDDEIALIKESCLMVCKTIAHVGSLLKPGVTGSFLDAEAEKFIRDHNGIPSFKGYGDEKPFPATLCMSVNDQVVHGVPSNREFQDGDIVSIDCGVFMNDFHGDAAYTFAIGDVNSHTMDLLSVTLTSLYKGIEQAIEGKRLEDIGFAIQDYTERKNRYYVVKDLVGHGIGRNLHEDPQVPNYGKRGRGIVLKSGLVIAIEPMINYGTREVRTLEDAWTIVAHDRKPSAHFEHTVVVRKKSAEILSDHTFIENAIKNNSELREISIKS
jgi:methionyl aminopeptidase